MTDDSRAHFLLAGDTADLAALRGISVRLPVDAYGQIFVEVASPAMVEPIDCPPGIAVTWMLRPSGADAGTRIAPAVDAWVAEWITGTGADTPMPYVIWVGCSSSRAVRELLRDLRTRIDDLHLHQG